MAIDATYDDSYFQRRSLDRPRLNIFEMGHRAVDRMNSSLDRGTDGFIRGVAKAVGLQRKDRELNPVRLTSEKAKAPSLLSRVLNPFQSASKLEEKKEEQEKKAPGIFSRATASLKRSLGLDEDSKKKRVSLAERTKETAKKLEPRLEVKVFDAVVKRANDMAQYLGIIPRTHGLRMNQLEMADLSRRSVQATMSRDNLPRLFREGLPKAEEVLKGKAIGDEFKQLEIQTRGKGNASLTRDEKAVRSPDETITAAIHGLDPDLAKAKQADRGKNVRVRIGNLASRFYDSGIPGKAQQQPQRNFAFSQ